MLYLISSVTATSDAFFIQYLAERAVQGTTCWAVGAFGGAYIRSAAHRLRDR